MNADNKEILCPKCNHPAVKFGHYKDRQKYRCKMQACGHVFSPRDVASSGNRIIPPGLREVIINMKDLGEDTSYARIAEKYGYDEKVISKLYKDYCDKVEGASPIKLYDENKTESSRDTESAFDKDIKAFIKSGNLTDDTIKKSIEKNYESVSDEYRKFLVERVANILGETNESITENNVTSFSEVIKAQTSDDKFEAEEMDDASPDVYLNTRSNHLNDYKEFLREHALELIIQDFGTDYQKEYYDYIHYKLFGNMPIDKIAEKLGKPTTSIYNVHKKTVNKILKYYEGKLNLYPYLLKYKKKKDDKSKYIEQDSEFGLLGKLNRMNRKAGPDAARDAEDKIIMAKISKRVKDNYDKNETKFWVFVYRILYGLTSLYNDSPDAKEKTEIYNITSELLNNLLTKHQLSMIDNIRSHFKEIVVYMKTKETSDPAVIKRLSREFDSICRRLYAFWFFPAFPTPYHYSEKHGVKKDFNMDDAFERLIKYIFSVSNDRPAIPKP